MSDTYMFIVIIFLLLGILVGYFLRKRAIPSQSVITALIWLLLFCLGAEVGNHPRVLSGIMTLGADALLLAAGGTLGSLCLALLLWRHVESRKRGGAR